MFLLLPWFTEIPVFNLNSADPDQSPLFVNVPFMGRMSQMGLGRMDR